MKQKSVRKCHFLSIDKVLQINYTYLVVCQWVIQLGGPVFKYYRVVPPRWGLVSSVNFYFVNLQSVI